MSSSKYKTPQAIAIVKHFDGMLPSGHLTRRRLGQIRSATAPITAGGMTKPPRYSNPAAPTSASMATSPPHESLSRSVLRDKPKASPRAAEVGAGSKIVAPAPKEPTPS